MSVRLGAVISLCVSIFAATGALLINTQANAQTRPAASAAAKSGAGRDVRRPRRRRQSPPSRRNRIRRNAKNYTVTGSGNNMWMTGDEFQFAWKKMSGDISITANITFYGLGGNAHRKAVLMIRQSLDGDSVYVDAALHGNGLTALQYREEKGADDQRHRVQRFFDAAHAPRKARRLFLSLSRRRQLRYAPCRRIHSPSDQRRFLRRHRRLLAR